MQAVRRAETFVTYGPLLEFAVNGQPMGSRWALPASGGTVDVTWQAASVTVPMTRVELMVNGEVRESIAVAPGWAAGSWPVKVGESAWLALLVRGRYEDKPEMIAAHSSPVMIDVQGSPMMAATECGHDPGADRGGAGLPGHGGHPGRGNGLPPHAPGADLGAPEPAQPDAPVGLLSRPHGGGGSRGTSLGVGGQGRPWAASCATSAWPGDTGQDRVDPPRHPRRLLGPIEDGLALTGLLISRSANFLHDRIADPLINRLAK